MTIDKKELKEWATTIIAGIAVFGFAIFGFILVMALSPSYRQSGNSEVKKLTALLSSERTVVTELTDEVSRLYADTVFYINRNEQAIAITEELLAMTRQPEGPVYAKDLIQAHCDYQEKLLELLDTLEEVWE